MKNVDFTTTMVIDGIKDAYITVMGKAKWNSLTTKEKHDVIMTLAKDAYEALKGVE